MSFLSRTPFPWPSLFPLRHLPLHLLLLAAVSACGGNDASPAPDASTADGAASSAAKVSCKVDRAETASSALKGASFAVVNGSTSPHTGSVPLMPGQEKAIGGMLYNGSQQGCSGTIVADRAVITASHCVIDWLSWDGLPETVSKYALSPSEVWFGVGKDMKDPDYAFEVKEIHIHPEVRNTFSYLENDIAVLVLKESATTKVPGLVPIPVNLEAIGSSEVGGNIEMGGFGSLTCGTYDFSPIRYFAQMELTEVLDRNIGVKAVSGGASMGDSGSGLLLERSDGKTRVAGLLSLGLDDTCTVNAGPRLDAYGAWLSGLLSDGCGAVTAAGSCVKGVAIWCEGNEVVSQDCTAKNKSCGEDTCGQNRCIDKPATTDERCTGLDYFGRCTGEVAEWCVEGQFRARDCGALGQSCAKSSDPWVGYTCTGAAGDGGAKDGAAAERTWPDGSTPTGSCEELDVCIGACDDDYWCEQKCLYAASSTAKVLWGEWDWCCYCGAYADKNYCDSSASYFGGCKTECASGGQTCVDCLSDLCVSYGDACYADRKEAGVAPTDGGVSKEAGTGG